MISTDIVKIPIIEEIKVTDYYIEFIEGSFYIYIKDTIDKKELIMFSDASCPEINYVYRDCINITLNNNLITVLDHSFKYADLIYPRDNPKGYICIGVIKDLEEQYSAEEERNVLRGWFYPYRNTTNKNHNLVSYLNTNNKVRTLNVNLPSLVSIRRIRKDISSLDKELQVLLMDKEVENYSYHSNYIHLEYIYERPFTREGNYYYFYTGKNIDLIYNSYYYISLDPEDLKVFSNLSKDYPYSVNIYSFGIHRLYANVEGDLYIPREMVVLLVVNTDSNILCIYVEPFLVPKELHSCTLSNKEQEYLDIKYKGYPLCFGRRNKLTKYIDPYSIDKFFSINLINPEEIGSNLYKITYK